MSNPLPRNLVTLAEQHIKDSGKLILSNGKVTNGKRGKKRIEWSSVYEYGLTLWKAGMITRKSGVYSFAKSWYGMPYPYNNKRNKR